MLDNGKTYKGNLEAALNCAVFVLVAVGIHFLELWVMVPVFVVVLPAAIIAKSKRVEALCASALAGASIATVAWFIAEPPYF